MNDLINFLSNDAKIFLIICVFVAFVSAFSLVLSFIKQTGVFVPKFKQKLLNIWTISSAVSMAGAIMAAVIIGVVVDDKAEELKTAIREEYKVEIQSPITQSSLETLKKTTISDKFIAVVSEANDQRSYEVYIKKESENNYILCTKNEKGVYLPITKMSVSTLENGNDS